jgi:hypothetical protein
VKKLFDSQEERKVVKTVFKLDQNRDGPVVITKEYEGDKDCPNANVLSVLQEVVRDSQKESQASSG